MTYKVLTEEQVEQFIERGWVLLKEAFPRDCALAAQDVVWSHVEKRGVLKDDRTTWTEEKIQLNEAYRTPEFDLCNTEKLADAIEDLVGVGRWTSRGQSVTWGWWPVNFSIGVDAPWDVPKSGWHYDGIHFKHRIDSPDQGLLLLCMFSEIGQYGGGTLVAEGSHNVVANILAEQSKGLELGEAIRLAKQHPWLAELTGATETSDENRVERFMNTPYEDPAGFSLRVVETVASPGDVILCHPFLFHTPSQNHSGTPRFMCNRTTPLVSSMNLERDNPNEYSPLERSVRKAIHRE